MDPSSHTNFYHHGYQILSPIKTHNQQPIYKTPSHSPDTSSPILVIALLGIMTTAFLLVGYYVFVIKCWLNFHQIDVVRRFSFRQARRTEDPLMGYDSARPSHGVDESVIRAIPIVQFKGEGLEISYLECAVCLNEFQEEEKLRVLPSCTHAFHIDCIDIWLQNNANCPLCRSSISTTTTTTRFPLDQIIAPTSSPQDQTPFTETVLSSDENFVVIEIRGDDDSDQTSSRCRETAKSGELSVQSINHSPRKLEQRTTMNNKKGRKFHHVSSMGDECIDIRGKDDQFKVQPIRRSISMDSSADRQLYLAVQEIIQQKQNRHFNEVSTSEGCSSSSKVRRSFFSFGHSRGSSRSAVLPIQFE